jgi:magnesium chelatase family protein
MDRIDMQIEVPAVPFKELSAETCGPPSADYARTGGGRGRFRPPGRSPGKTRHPLQCPDVHQPHPQALPLDAQGLALLERAMEAFRLSARAYGRILKIARTIADLDGRDDISLAHLSEAIGYRSLDRGMP